MVYSDNGILVNVKKKSYKSMKRHGGTSNVYYLVEEANLKNGIYCVIPTIWPSGKGKTM